MVTLPKKNGAVQRSALDDENVVEHQQRDRQHRRHAQDVQRVRQRNEAPFRRGQVEEVADDHAEREEVGQDPQQQRQAVEERVASLETQIEARQQRKRGRQRVMHRDQEIAQGQLRKTRHFD